MSMPGHREQARVERADRRVLEQSLDRATVGGRRRRRHGGVERPVRASVRNVAGARAEGLDVRDGERAAVRAARIAPKAAIASRPATRAIALLIAEPMPAWRWSMSPRIAAVSGDTVTARPSAEDQHAGQHLGE